MFSKRAEGEDQNVFYRVIELALGALAFILIIYLVIIIVGELFGESEHDFNSVQNLGMEIEQGIYIMEEEKLDTYRIKFPFSLQAKEDMQKLIVHRVVDDEHELCLVIRSKEQAPASTFSKEELQEVNCFTLHKEVQDLTFFSGQLQTDYLTDTDVKPTKDILVHPFAKLLTYELSISRTQNGYVVEIQTDTPFTSLGGMAWEQDKYSPYVSDQAYKIGDTINGKVITTIRQTPEDLILLDETDQELGRTNLATRITRSTFVLREVYDRASGRGVIPIGQLIGGNPVTLMSELSQGLQGYYANDVWLVGYYLSAYDYSLVASSIEQAPQIGATIGGKRIADEKKLYQDAIIAYYASDDSIIAFYSPALQASGRYS